MKLYIEEEKFIENFKKKLENAVIEDLINSFIDLENENPYDFILDRYGNLIYGSVGDMFIYLLKSIDWNKINKKLASILIQNKKKVI